MDNERRMKQRRRQTRRSWLDDDPFSSFHGRSPSALILFPSFILTGHQHESIAQHIYGNSGPSTVTVSSVLASSIRTDSQHRAETVSYQLVNLAGPGSCLSFFLLRVITPLLAVFLSTALSLLYRGNPTKKKSKTRITASVLKQDPNT